MSYLTRLTLVKLIAAGVIDIPTQLLNNSYSERPERIPDFLRTFVDRIRYLEESPQTLELNPTPKQNKK